MIEFAHVGLYVMKIVIKKPARDPGAGPRFSSCFPQQIAVMGCRPGVSTVSVAGLILCVINGATCYQLVTLRPCFYPELVDATILLLSVRLRASLKSISSIIKRRPISTRANPDSKSSQYRGQLYLASSCSS